MEKDLFVRWEPLRVFIDEMPYSLIWPDQAHGRARKVVQRSNYKHPVKLMSVKNSGIVEVESLLEYDRAILLETDCSVQSFQEQPFLIEYMDEGKKHKIYPDFLVQKKDGTKVIEEVKPIFKLSDPRVSRRFSIEKRILEKEDYGFSVMTEREIRFESNLNMIKKIYAYRRRKVSPVIRELVLDELLKKTCSSHELIQKIEGLVEEDLFSLVTNSVISFAPDPTGHRGYLFSV